MNIHQPKVFLGNSPWYRPGYYGVRAGSRWPHFERNGDPYMPFPFYLAYAAAILERENIPHLLVDGVAERIKEEDFLKKLSGFEPDITILEVATASIETDLSYAEKIKKLHPKATLVFTGPHIEMYECDFLDQNPNVDICTIGEYEYTVRDLVKSLSNSGDISRIQGIVYRDKSGKAVSTGKRPLIENLDELPWPARHQLPMLAYHDNPGGIPSPSLQIWASRGCPFRCTFCAWPQIMYGGHKYRVRDPKDVVAEIIDCKEKYGFKSFYFDDDTFNIGKPRIMALCEEIKKADLCMPWAVMARADTADREMLQAMKEAGLCSIKYGVESASQELVNACKKNLDLSKVNETVKISRDLGLNIHLTFTFGLPGETWETLNKTIDFALKLSPDSLQFSIVTPFPGSELYTAMDKKGYLLTKDFTQYDGYSTAVIRTDDLTAEELEKGLQLAVKKWERHKILRVAKKPSKWIKAVSHPIWAVNEAKRAFGIK